MVALLEAEYNECVEACGRQGGGRNMSIPRLLVGSATTSLSMTAAPVKSVTHPIAADEITWCHGPSGIHPIIGGPLDDEASALVQSGRDRIGKGGVGCHAVIWPVSEYPGSPAGSLRTLLDGRSRPHPARCKGGPNRGEA